jgi:putative hydrolase of the HAD superfamily
MTTIKAVLFDLGDTLVDRNRHWLPGAESAIAALKAAGKRVGIISDTDTLTREELRAHLPSTFTFDTFDPALVLLSSEVGIEKPALGIFQLAIERAQLEARSIFFCTETVLHVLAAQRAGMMALRLQPPPHSDVGELPAWLKAVEALS